jgi:hypothetical protein
MKELYVKAKETAIAETLNTVVKEFPQVTIGSYPKLFHRFVRPVRNTHEFQSFDSYLAFPKLGFSLILECMLQKGQEN